MLDVAVRNLMFDAADGIEIFDTENDRVMTKAEVDAKIKELCFQYTGLNEKSTDKQIKRALQSESGREFFAVIEEIIDIKVQQGLEGVDVFNKYVDEINLADGDINEFWAEKETFLEIEKVPGSSHDFELESA